MSVVGEWELYADWGCTGTYNSVAYPIIPIRFNSDGTVFFPLSPSNVSCRWVQVDGMVMWSQDPRDSGGVACCFAGNKAGNAMVGIMSLQDSRGMGRGCWYAIRKRRRIGVMRRPKPEFEFFGQTLKTREMPTGKTGK